MNGSPRCRLFGFTLLLAVMVCGAASAAKPKGEAGPDYVALRNAITDLSQTYGDRYPNARNYLARLATIEAEGDAAAFRKLQREALVANPLVSGQPILYVARHQYRSDHHSTATIFQNGEINTGKFQGPGAIRTVDLARGNKVTTLLETPGVARDPELSYDARRIVFSMRRNRGDDYHIYTMALGETEPKQLTHGGGVADIDPVFLPDGSIVFAGSRDHKFCQCNRHIMCNLYRMDGEGANIHQIGGSGLFEGHPHLMPDGRILYDRWEYVDRQFGPSFGLWTITPDGANPALFYGNNAWAPGMIADARMIPRTHHFIATFGSCHDRPWGALAVVDRSRGFDGYEPVLKIWPASARRYLENQRNAHWNPGGIDVFKRVRPRYEDPWPLSDKYFLCSREIEKERMGLFLIDVFGNEVLLHEEKTLGCYDPMPIAPRPAPAETFARTEPAGEEGHFYVYDVYRGTGMEKVERGTIRYLRIVEAPYKRTWTSPGWGIDATQAPAMNWNLTNNKRILGDVPVEKDGSAYFTVPANRFIYFLALDENKMMVQAMRSGTLIQPGETTGCIGCHEDRHMAVPNSMRLAWQRKPSRLKPWYGKPRLFNYLTEVQPVFDRKCVECHDYNKEAGRKLNLAGDLGPVFNTSYLELHRRSAVRWSPDQPGQPKLLIKAVHDGPPAVLPPYAWGSHRSKLIDVIRGDHHDVKLTEEETARIVTWIDLNAPYYGSYASAYPNHPFGRSPLNGGQLAELSKLLNVNLGASNIYQKDSPISFTRPEISPALAAIRDQPEKYQRALAIIQAGQEALKNNPRADMAGFSPADPDQQRLGKAARLAEAERRARQALATGEKFMEKSSPSAKP